MNKLLLGTAFVAAFTAAFIGARVEFGHSVAAQEAPEAEAPAEAPAGRLVEVSNVDITVITPAPNQAKLKDIILTQQEDTFRLRKNEADENGALIPLTGLCAGQVIEIAVDGLPTLRAKVEGGVLTVGTEAGAEKTLEVSCPPPAGFEDLSWVWEQRAGEHSMNGEFTDAHLRAMIDVINAGEPILYTPQRVKGYQTGGDHQMVIASLEQHLGQFPAYVLEVDGLQYIVPVTEELAACGGLCTEPRLVVWHLHQKQKVHTPRKPRVLTPEPEAPVFDPYRVRCGGCD